MSRCKWMTDEEGGCFDGICVNDKCPMIADYCPVANCPEFCMYSETGGPSGTPAPTGAETKGT